MPRPISSDEAERMQILWIETDMKTVYETFPQYSKYQIKRAISDHVDRLIETHRNKR